MTQSKPKLLYIVTQAEWGGAQRYVFDLATALKDEFDILVAAGVGGDQELLKKCNEAGIRTHTLKNLVREINPFKDLAVINELAKFFKEENPDIIHLNSSKAGIIGALASKLQTADCRLQNFIKSNLKSEIINLKFEIIYTAHGWVFEEPLSLWRKKLYIQMERTACKIHDKVIILSQADFDIAIKNKICLPEKMVIIPHGIKSIDFLPREEAKKQLAANYQLPTANFWIGTIANLYKTKGIGYLIEAIKNLSEEGIKPNFIIIGEGQEKRNLELRIRNYGLENFYLTGSLPDAAKYLKAFDAFALPSLKEGLPYALLEAMQAGLPIIATNVGAIPEMIENEKSGLLVKPKDSKMLREAIKKLINDAGLRDKLGREAQKTFQEKFDFQKMIEATIKIYAG